MSPATPPAGRARRPAVISAVFGVLFLAVYGVVVANQHDVGVAWGYVAVVVLGIGCCMATAATGKAVTAAVAAVLYGVCLLLGLASLGILLLPATVLAVMAFVFARKDRAAAVTPAPPERGPSA